MRPETFIAILESFRGSFDQDEWKRVAQTHHVPDTRTRSEELFLLTRWQEEFRGLHPQEFTDFQRLQQMSKEHSLTEDQYDASRLGEEWVTSEEPALYEDVTRFLKKRDRFMAEQMAQFLGQYGKEIPTALQSYLQSGEDLETM